MCEILRYEMNYIQNLKERFIVKMEQKPHRQLPIDKYAMAKTWSGLTDTERAVKRLKFMLENEFPVVWPDEKIALIRTVPVIAEMYTEEEYKALEEKFTIHEQGKVCNISPNYTLLLDCGFDKKREEIRHIQGFESNEFLQSLLSTMDIIEDFSNKYKDEAKKVSNKIVEESFSQIPAKAPETFLQALQFLRLLHYSLWQSFNYHNTLGRFDQYLYPYFKNDIDKGIITMDEAQELVEEFFLSCNKDSDLYTGMQQGDNGQSIVLGGYTPEGEDGYNELSEICMTACENLRLIDPKINLRVNKTTPITRYIRGSKLTKLGLGFPQYSNDDVVVPCLINWGYDKKDAYDYAMAACWEFIIPGYGMDIPNINGMSFSLAVNNVLKELPKCQNFEEFLSLSQDSIKTQTKTLVENVKEIYMEPAPLMSLLMNDCVANKKDISLGNKYNNFGFHGTGISTAVDSLSAIKKHIFEEKTFTAETLTDMIDKNFVGYDEENNLLRYHSPKMGNDDPVADDIAVKLIDTFADSVQGFTNCRGGIYRAGTGSAMYYIWHANEDFASPDGRKIGEPLACNYSPGLFSRCNGPISIIKSFSKPNLNRVANGGPLTIELHDTIFKNEDSIAKVAAFVKSFMNLGGHQMQINSVNRDVMIDAKAHPENYRNLIVRVWGWSGYFVELDEVYQDHIIERSELII